MTIAACYVCPEGVVLGADSTSTWQHPGMPDHFYHNEQKVFEIGQNSSLAICMWGLGSLKNVSYRQLIAELADDIAVNPIGTVEEAAIRWRDRFWATYSNKFAADIHRFQALSAIAHRTPHEEAERQSYLSLRGGFCIGGHAGVNRTPFAYEILYGADRVPEPPRAIGYGEAAFWGCPNITQRLVWGIDEQVFNDIISSGKWHGTPNDLLDIVMPQVLSPPGLLPLREAIDWVYSSIFVTIKAMKFSRLSQVCGGPIEVAAISTDRQFRWVSHKGLDEAISHRPLNQRPNSKSE